MSQSEGLGKNIVTKKTFLDSFINQNIVKLSIIFNMLFKDLPDLFVLNYGKFFSLKITKSYPAYYVGLSYYFINKKRV